MLGAVVIPVPARDVTNQGATAAARLTRRGQWLSRTQRPSFVWPMCNRCRRQTEEPVEVVPASPLPDLVWRSSLQRGQLLHEQSLLLGVGRYQPASPQEQRLPDQTHLTAPPGGALGLCLR